MDFALLFQRVTETEAAYLGINDHADAGTQSIAVAEPFLDSGEGLVERIDKGANRGAASGEGCFSASEVA
jgi:hypothetical protein